MINDFYDLKQISSGISSNVYKAKDIDGSGIIIKGAISNDFANINRIISQYDIQKYLYKYFPVSRPILLDASNNPPFYTMEYIDGEHRTDELSIKVSIDLLDSLHSIKLNDTLNRKIKGKGYIGYIIKKIYKQYQIRKTEFSPEICHIFTWLMDNKPSQVINSIVHNDWKMTNILFNKKDQPVVLDWEMFDVGDPRLDFAIFTSYWPSHDWISDEPNYCYSRDKVIKYAMDKFSMTEDEWKFFEVLSIFRLISIVQLGIIRYDNKVIANEKYNGIHDKIYIAIDKCERIINNI